MSEETGAGGTTTQVQPAVETGPKPVSWAPVPKVNLLPLEIVENRAFRRTQIVLVGAVVLAAGAVGLGTVWAQRGVDDAQAEADAAHGRVAELQTQKAEYTAIPGLVAQVEAAEAARQNIYASDVRWYRYLNTLARTSDQAGVDLSDVTITVTSNAATATDTAGDVLTPAGIGTFTFNGSSAEYRQVSGWLEAVDETTGLQGAKLMSATRTEGDADDPPEVTFSTTAVLDTEALSGRYQPKDEAAADPQSGTTTPDSTGSTPAPSTGTDSTN